MHIFIYMWGIAKIRVSVGQSAHDLFSKHMCRGKCEFEEIKGRWQVTSDK